MVIWEPTIHEFSDCLFGLISGELVYQNNNWNLSAFSSNHCSKIEPYDKDNSPGGNFLLRRGKFIKGFTCTAYVQITAGFKVSSATTTSIRAQDLSHAHPSKRNTPHLPVYNLWYIRGHVYSPGAQNTPHGHERECKTHPDS